MDDFNNQNNQNNGQQDYYSQYNSNQPDYNNQYNNQYNGQPDYSNQYNNQYNGQPDYSNPYNNQYGNGQPDYNNQYNYNNQPYYQPQQYPQYVEQQEDKSAKNFAIASLVLGIVSFFCCGTICSVLGLIFGIISKSRQKDNNGMAIAGIVLSSITLVLSIVGVLFFALSPDNFGYYY